MSGDSSDALAGAVISDLASPDDGVRRTAAEKLGNIKDPQAVTALLLALKDPARHVRWTAALALAKIGVKTPPVIPQLIASLDDPDPYVRKYVAGSLANLGAEEAADAILKAIDKYNQPELAEALQHLPLGAGAIAYLVKALNLAIAEWRKAEDSAHDEDQLAHMYDPRKAAVGAFRGIRDPAAAHPLVEILKNPPAWDHFAQAARLGLEGVGEPALPAVLAALNSPSGKTARGHDELLKSLAVLGSLAAFQALVAMAGAGRAAILAGTTMDWWKVRDDQPGTRSLKKVGWAGAQVFLPGVTDPVDEVRRATARILGHARDKQATPYLLGMLKRERDPAALEFILWSLEALADPVATFALIAELEGKHAHPAQLALVAIGRPAREALLQARTQVRPEAREALEWVINSIR